MNNNSGSERGEDSMEWFFLHAVCNKLKHEKVELDAQLATQTERVKSQDAEIANLRKFAEHMLYQYAWESCADPDGGDIQDTAEKLGLIELRPIDPEDSIDGETEHYFPKWTPKQALNQDSSGDQP